MNIYTSRYGNKALASHPGAKMGITVGRPRWGLNYEMTWFPKLGPDRSYLNASKDVYEPRYIAKLEAVGIDWIMDELNRRSEINGGADVILLCFEDLRKEGEWCHRRMLAEWIEDKTGIVVEELPEVDPTPKPSANQMLLF